MIFEKAFSLAECSSKPLFIRLSFICSKAVLLLALPLLLAVSKDPILFQILSL